jgi:hypothetical protein
MDALPRLTPHLTAVVLVGLVAALAALAGIDARATYGARTTADEPQYLLTAASLAEDRDLDIADEIAAREYEPFHEVTIDRQTRVLDGGREISPHDPLLPALLALPYALGGWVAAKATLALVGGVTAALAAWVAIRRYRVAPHVAAVVVGGVFAGIPLAAYGTQVYPELPAGLAALAGLVALSGPAMSTRHVVTACSAIVALPWLGIKYAPVAAVLALVLVVRLRLDRRRIAVVVGAMAVSGLAYLVIHRWWYGGWTPYATGDHFADTGELSVVGTDVDVVGRSRRLVGLLVDREFGIAAWSPIWLLLPLAVGFATARARRGPDATRPGWAWWTVVGVTWANATFVALTMHGWWVPGRQLVVALPAAAVLLAWTVDRWRRLRWPAVALALAGAVSWTWLAVEASTGRRTLVLDFMDTGAWPYRLLAPALPSGLDDAPHDVMLLAAWTVVAALAIAIGVRAGRRRPPAAGASDQALAAVTVTGVESVAASRWHFER